MNKWQQLAIGATIVAFFIMYFGCETKPKNIKDLEKSRSLTLESTSIQNLMTEARKNLKEDQRILIETLEESWQKDTSNLDKIKALSSTWYDLGHASISGHYAELIAQKSGEESAWSMAGTTYALCIKNAESPKEKDFCTSKAITAFENAISIQPSNIDHRINLALCYIENPPQDNPMKGILLLRELNGQYPENVNVLNQLARLAIKTNQLDKALERLTKAVELDPENKTSACLLAEVYAMKNETEKSEKYKIICSK